MAVKISGVLKDGTGKPVQNCTIQLKAKRNSTTVVVNTLASENPDEAGRYSMDVEYGQYSVILLVEGFPPSHAGTITVYEDSQPGTLNDFLGAMTEDDVRPEALRRFEAMVEEVARQASEASRNATAAWQASEQAQTSAGQASESATAAVNAAGAAEASATQAASSAASATNAANSASAANTAKTGAEAARDAANTAKTGAEAARDAANTAKTGAEAARDAALDAQTAAELAEANAKISETNAAESKRLAEAAIDVANSSAGIYQDTTSGLAGTATGGYFSVPSPLDDEVLILYRNDAGIATEVKRYPSAAGVENTRVSMIGVAASLVLTQSIIAAHHAFL
ncbi:prophage tail fiber N-terminal domain-containing protein [Escherichia coli]